MKRNRVLVSTFVSGGLWLLYLLVLGRTKADRETLLPIYFFFVCLLGSGITYFFLSKERAEKFSKVMRLIGVLLLAALLNFLLLALYEMVMGMDSI